MPRFLNPAAIAAPASRYSHGVEHAADARRVVVSGQIGMGPDGSLADGFEAQAVVAFDNLLAVVAEAGMAASDLVKVTAFATEPGQVAVFRAVRDRKLGGTPRPRPIWRSRGSHGRTIWSRSRRRP
jgi:2-iminobutanoate/2-iminopropanoate deaminase